MPPKIALEHKLTLDAKEAQLLRVQRLRIASATSIGAMLLLFLAYQMALLPLRPMLALEALVIAQIVLFRLAFSTGLNRRFKDPSLAIAQTLGSTLVMLLSAHFADPQARTFAMLLIPLSFAFAAFGFGSSDLFRLSLSIIALVAVEAGVASLLPPHQLGFRVAMLNLGGLALCLTAMSVIGGSLNDLRRKTQFERAMAEQAIAKLAEAVVAVDVNGRVSFLNAGAARLFGLGAALANGRQLNELFRLDGDRDPSSLIADHRASAGVPTRAQIHVKIRCLQPGAITLRDVEISTSSINGQRGADIGYVLVLRDVTEHNGLLRELGHAATHDELTHLQNRRGFSARLTQLLDPHTLRRHEHTLLLMDLDQFKIVNDTCGHQAGDDLLREVASILRAHFPNAHCLARLGGDEFGVLLCEVEPAVADRDANELLRALINFRFVRDERLFNISASIGITTLSDGASDDEVMAQADAACYLAKEMGRNQVRRYRADAQDMLRHQTEMHWVTRINEALTNDKFILYCQRIVLAKTAGTEPSEYELLLRLLAPDGSIIGPDQFLPAAERFNLMPSIDRWVIGKAFDHLRQLVAVGGNPPKVAINVSASSLRDGSLALFIANQLTESGLSGQLFTFELTESAAVINFAQVGDFVVSMQALGCRVALDDVGTGFSSFAHLQILPVDQIKIDGSFVRTICDNPLDRVLVESLQRIAAVLGVTTVAEFVENDAIGATVRAMGVDYLQGYGMHRPEPLHCLLADAAKSNVDARGNSGAPLSVVRGRPRDQNIAVSFGGRG